jgi:hypothetical protein
MESPLLHVNIKVQINFIYKINFNLRGVHEFLGVLSDLFP